MQSISAAHSSYLKTRFFGSMDGLRCFSILAVIGFHTSLAFPGFLAPFGLDRWGWAGVALFFVISGFLITTLLLRERSDRGEISLKNFYVRRTLRIFPLYYAVLAIYVAISLAMERHKPEGQMFFANLKYFLTYTSNWFMAAGGREAGGVEKIHFQISWSLATEEQFYLVWPIVVRFARPWFVPVIFITLVLLGAETLTYLNLADVLNMTTMPAVTLASLPAICIGCLLAYAMHYPAGFKQVYALLGQSWSAVAAAIVVAICLAYVRGFYMPLMHLSMAALLGAVCIRENQPLRSILAWAPARYIGTISYGIYLMHSLCKNAVERKIHMPLAQFIATVLVSVAVASISYQLYEKPFLRLKNRWGGRRDHSVPVPAGAPLKAVAASA